METKSEHKIRPAVPGDSREIAEVQVNSYRTAYAGWFPESYLERFSYEEQTQDWLELMASSPDDILLVATSEEEEVIGYVLARAEPDIYPDFDAEILALHVAQAFQRKDIGKALLTRVVEELEQKGCRSVMLWTLKGNPIRHWYDRLQGRIISEKSYRVDDREIVEIAYGWDNISSLGEEKRQQCIL
jgi:ribosomal protein S18 acetylase RimI-like enzyme